MEPEDNSLPVSLSLPEYLAIIRRRRAIILQAFGLISAIGVFVTFLTKPVYQASAKMLVEGQSYSLNTIDTKNPLSSLFAVNQQQAVETQVEVLQAQPLLDAVTKQVGRAVLTVSQVKDTNVIEVTAEATDPRTAASAPNTLLQMFIAQNSDQDLAEMERARQFVVTQGKLAHQKLSASETALLNFKQKNHLVEVTKSQDAQLTRVNALNAQYQEEETSLASLRAQLSANRSLLSQEPPVTLVTVHQTNPVIAGLQADIRNLEVQRVGLVQPRGFGAEAPQVRALDAQIAELRRRIAEQPSMATSQSASPNAARAALAAKVKDLQTQMATVQAQEALTLPALTQAKAQVGSYTGLEVTQAGLLREHDDAATADKMFSDQLADLDLREKAHHATAHIIEAAKVPTTPVRPRKLQSIAFACLIGLLTGLCLALLQEFLDDRINSVEEANRILGLPSLGHVPALTAEDAHLLPQMKGLDPASESYRVLRTNINFASVDAPARTLLVTSANPGEGKSTTAANLAFAMAMDGKKVILVDTDLRRPSLHKLLNLDPVPGLTDVLLGESALHPREVMPGLLVLTAGTTPPNPGELLNTRTFRNLVDYLMDQADVVIFDSPPVLAAADATILASQMDGTILVVETGMTRKGAARRALQLLTQARANILGVAYNKMRAQDSSGYYYYYQYKYMTPGKELPPAMAEETNGRQRTQLPAIIDFGKPDFGKPDFGKPDSGKPSAKPAHAATEDTREEGRSE